MYRTKKEELRVEKMLSLRLQKKTLEEIGKVFHISRERVRQLISKDPRYQGVEQRIKPTLTKKCKTCGSEYFTKNVLRKYCSINCVASKKKVIHDQEWHRKQREFNRIRCNKYYHEVLKKRPDFKQLIHERNIKYSLKKKNKNEKLVR